MTFEFTEDYSLENERVLLQPLTEAHENDLIQFSINEPNLWQYALLRADGPEHMKKYLDSALNGRYNEHSYPYMVYDKRAKKYAGSTRFYDIQKDHKTTQLGYTWYGADFQGTGLNKNCKLLMLTFAFETIGFERVEFRADNNNARSIAAMKSIGCTVEGVLRSNCKSTTGRRDSIILGILKDEWFGGVKEALERKVANQH